MPDRRAVSVLDTHLWSLRAEVEAQLRTLTEVQRHVHHFPPRNDPQRSTHLTTIALELEQILDATVIIRELCISALNETQAVER
jgi:hypothetical protein